MKTEKRIKANPTLSPFKRKYEQFLLQQKSKRKYNFRYEFVLPGYEDKSILKHIKIYAPKTMNY